VNTTASTIHRLSSCSLTGLNCSSSAVNDAFVCLATINKLNGGICEGGSAFVEGGVRRRSLLRVDYRESLSLSRRTERESQTAASSALPAIQLQ